MSGRFHDYLSLRGDTTSSVALFKEPSAKAETPFKGLDLHTSRSPGRLPAD